MPQKKVARVGKNTKKTSTRKRASATPEPIENTNESPVRGEVFGILTLTAATLVFIALLYSENAGLIGEFVHMILFGLFGKAAFAAVIMMYWLGISAFFSKSSRNAYKYWLIILTVFFTSIILQLVDYEPDSTIASYFTYGRLGIGGGLVGGLVTRVLTHLLAVPGAWIVSVAGALITLLLVTGVSIRLVVSKMYNSAVNSAKTFQTEMRHAPKPNKDDEPEAVLIAVNDKPADKATTDKDERYGPVEQKYFKEYFTKEPETSDPKEIVPITPEPVEIPLDVPAEYPWEKENAQSAASEIADNIEEISAKPYITDIFPVVGDKPEDTAFADHIGFEPYGNNAPTGNEPFGGNAPTGNEPFGNNAPMGNEPFGGNAPMGNEPFGGNAPMGNEPFGGNAPMGNEPFGGNAESATAGEFDDPLSAPMGMSEFSQNNDDPTFEHHNNDAVFNTPIPIPDYKLPPVNLLSKPAPRTKNSDQLRKELEYKANKLIETLASFGVQVTIQNVVQGPTVTRFEVMPGAGVKVSKIISLSEDIALSLASTGVLIAPISGKSVVGIEVPNQNADMVTLREVVDSPEFRNFPSKTCFAVGKDIAGQLVIADISRMPHLLVAGATGSGKSVCINSLITSVLYRAKPNEVKMIMIDPKMVELTGYNGIPHLYIPVVTDAKRAASALNWAVMEMENRYKLFEGNRCRNLTTFNDLMEKRDEPDSKLPEVIIIIDELADLMAVAKADVETSINRLAAKARAAGMYLIIATQRPSVNVITGVIKANVPSRIAFAVASQIDSRTIINEMGAEKLIGRGDMLFHPYGAAKPMRVQGNFVSDEDLENIIDFVKAQNPASYDEDIIRQIDALNETQKVEDRDDTPGQADELLPRAVELSIEQDGASVASLQRSFKIGYQRAARIIDQMEARRLVGPYEGTKPRQVLVTREQFNEMMAANNW